MCGIFIGDGFNAYQKQKRKSKSGLNRKEYLNNRNSKGQFVKGNTNDKFNTCESFRIYLDISENDKARKKLEKILNNLDIKYTTPKNKSGEHVYFTSKDWLLCFSQFRKGAHNKTIPKWMLDYDYEFLKELYNGLIDSDGSYQQNDTYTTVSNNLLLSLIELSMKIGKVPNFSIKHTDSIIEDRRIVGDSYNLNFANQNKTIRRDKITKEKYKGKIWCIEVKNKNFLVSRNNKMVFCGNTDEVYGDAPKGIKYLETDRHNPRNPYSASKSGSDQLANAYYHTYKLPIVTTNCMNIIGERQDTEKFLPMCIRNALNGYRTDIHCLADMKTSGSRFYIHAKNVAAACLFLYKNGKHGDVYNIEGQKELTNLQVYQKVCEILGAEYYYRMVDFHNSSHGAGHDTRYALNGEKLFNMGFEYPISFDISFETIVKWSVQKENLKWIK